MHAKHFLPSWDLVSSLDWVVVANTNRKPGWWRVLSLHIPSVVQSHFPKTSWEECVDKCANHFMSISMCDHFRFYYQTAQQDSGLFVRLLSLTCSRSVNKSVLDHPWHTHTKKGDVLSLYAITLDNIEVGCPMVLLSISFHSDVPYKENESVCDFRGRKNNIADVLWFQLHIC